MTFSLLRNSRRSLAFVLLTSCVAIAACSGKTDDSNPPGDGDGDGDGDSSGGASGDGDSSGGRSGDGDSSGGVSGDGDAVGGMGGDSGNGGDGSGGTPACTDDIGCSVADAPFCYENSSVECSNTDDDECLEMVTATTCGIGTYCSEGESTPTCETGEACASAISVPEGGMSFSGDAFSADFSDDLILTGDECDDFSEDRSEVVFRVDMKAGEALQVYDTPENEMDFLTVVTKTCDALAACEYEWDDNPNGLNRYISETDETVYVFITSYSSSPTSQDDPYSLIFERQMVPSIGTFAPGEAIPDVSHDSIVPVGGAAYYSITFTGPVWLSGTVARKTVGDVELYVFDSNREQVFYSEAEGDEEWTDQLLPTGTYYFSVYPYTVTDIPIAPGFDMTLSTLGSEDLGALVHGGTLMHEGGPIAAGSSLLFTLDLTENTVVSGSLTATNGDPDIRVYDAAGEQVTSFSASGLTETIDPTELPAGAYTVRIIAWDYELNLEDDVDSFNLTLNGAAP